MVLTVVQLISAFFGVLMILLHGILASALTVHVMLQKKYTHADHKTSLQYGLIVSIIINLHFFYYCAQAPSDIKLSNYHLSLREKEAFQLSFNVLYGPVNGVNCSHNENTQQQVYMRQTVINETTIVTLVEVDISLQGTNGWYNCTVFTHVHNAQGHGSTASFAIQGLQKCMCIS